MRHISLFLVTTVLGSLSIEAQNAVSAPKIDERATPNSNVSVRLIDGSVVYGVMERHDKDSIVVRGAGGRSAFPMSSVRELRNAGEPHVKSDGTVEYWYPNANTTRLFFAPTGRTLGRGEGYFANHDIVLGSVAFGMSDRFTMGGGSFLIPNSSFWFVTPKVGLVRSEKVNVAAGVLFGGVDDEVGGIGYLTSTLGRVDKNVTFAVGKAFSATDTQDSQIFMLGGETRLSRRISLVTENYVFPRTDPVVSYGIRILGDKTSVDLAFINVLSNNGMLFPGIPYVDFVIRF